MKLPADQAHHRKTIEEIDEAGDGLRGTFAPDTASERWHAKAADLLAQKQAQAEALSAARDRVVEAAIAERALEILACQTPSGELTPEQRKTVLADYRTARIFRMNAVDALNTLTAKAKGGDGG